MVRNFQLVALILFLDAFSVHSLKKVQNVTNDDGAQNTQPTMQGGAVLKVANKTKSPLKFAKGVNKIVKPVVVPKIKKDENMITLGLIQEWAAKISEQFYVIEDYVVRRETLLKSFSDIKIETRDGSAIVEKMAKTIEDLLIRRAQAAENITRVAEKLSTSGLHSNMPMDYQFDHSMQIDEIKPTLPVDSPETEKLLTCRSLQKVKLQESVHFDAPVSLDTSSVHVSEEVFDCDPEVIPHIYWSEKLLSTFRANYHEDATMSYQYFCSAKGFLRHYPATKWEKLFKRDLIEDVYDCRLRPWYVSAGGAPRDILILLDASGSMHESSNTVNAEFFTQALLNTLTDDDQVNVLRFNVVVESPISCFNNILVPANHVNSAAMMAAMKKYKMRNETKMDVVLTTAVRMLQRQQADPERAAPCQQAIVLIADSVYENFTDLMRLLDPDGKIRLFVFWLHDPNGLRDNTRQLGTYMSCDRDGYFAELTSPADVTEQVMRILRVLERPLVAQRKDRLRVFSDVYAHVEDPRRAEYYWRQKENREQGYRYRELRRNKDSLLSSQRMLHDYLYLKSFEDKGHYYEGEDVNYRLQISVSVPVFDYTTSENITKILEEEKQRNATRTYPVNRLIGVAGVDIQVDHLKLILPYHELGAGGSLFIIDHRGNIVLHDNLKPLFDGDILKPGYRTVDMIDLEQPAVDHLPRHYPREWLQFRKQVIIDKPRGNRTMHGKNIFEHGMRAFHEMREYHWRRVLDHYTAVVVLPAYNRRHAVPDSAFTQQLADDALKTISEFAIHPDWLYCRHIDPYFDNREDELRHFLRRRRDEPQFKMAHLKHLFTNIPPTLFEKTYQCNEKLMASVSKEAIATFKWAEEQDDLTNNECLQCQLGSITAFFASESGLLRWQKHFRTGARADPPDGSEWPRGPSEPWYKRAAQSPDILIVHAPVMPERKMRNSDQLPPPIGERAKWLTAARSLGQANKGVIGVTGYHFYPEHMQEFFDILTNRPITDEEDIEPRCDREHWSCVLIDEGGWVITTGDPAPKNHYDEPIRQHLATLYPLTMSHLLTANVFKLHWLHDYQAICFPPESEAVAGAAAMTSLVKSLWRTVNLLVLATRQIVTTLAVISLGTHVRSDTEFEKEKRRRRLKKDYEREKYEQLYDDRVLVNRTRVAACDRSRPLYEFQRTQASMEALSRHPHACTWPLIGAPVPKTNLILIAVYMLCPHDGRLVPDPMVNEPIEMTEEMDIHKDKASKLACWRNRVHLPGRPPDLTCYPHNYSQEVGYRQCGPWLPDPEPEEENGISSSAHQIYFRTDTIYLLQIMVAFAMIVT